MLGGGEANGGGSVRHRRRSVPEQNHYHTAQDLPAFEFLPNHNTPHSPPRKGERPLQPSASPLPPISTAEQSRAAPQLQVE